MRRGRLIWEGTASEPGGEGIGPETLFLTASAGKTATAATVLRLVDAGRVRLADPAREYLPRLPGGRRIRVRDLLRHSSGLPDYLGSARVARTIDSDPDHPWTRREVLATVGPPAFRPGSRTRYSNTNYVALGGVIERAGGGSVQNAFERLVRAPAGAQDATWRYDDGEIGRFAAPHVQRRGAGSIAPWRGGSIPTDYWGEVWTDGGLATTAADLALIANDLVAGPLLRPRTKRAMLRFRSGGTGLGVFAQPYAGRRWIGHDGLYGGYSAQQWTDPDRKLTLVALANLETRPGRPDASWTVWKRLAQASLLTDPG